MVVDCTVVAVVGRWPDSDHGLAGGAQRGVVLVPNRVWLASSAA